MTTIIEQMKRMINLKQLNKLIILAGMLLIGVAAKAQTTESNGYIIYYGGFLTHNASTGAVNTARSATFDVSTCLWTITGNYIRPVSSDGSSVLNNQYLTHANNGLGNANVTTNASWSNVSDGGSPSYTGGNTTRYLRVTGSTGNNPTWQVGTSNSSRGTIHAVTKTTVAVNNPASYDGTLNGTTAFYSAGATATYTPSVTYTAAHSLNTVTYSYSGGELASETTGTVPTPTTVNLNDGWTVEWSLSDDTYATISSSGVLTVSSTLPATFATTTVSYTATKGGNSVTASLPVTIYASQEIMEGVMGATQGVSGGVVTLNDYEDHSWSYYQPLSALPAGYPEELCSPYPANVKITYYGNGTNTVTTSTDVTPALSTFTASTNSGVAVGVGEPEGTFVYYKTLERTTGSAYGSATYSYTTIPNPFSIRPVYGSGNTRWRGFYAWRVKSVSGGTISGKEVGDIIDAETTVSFIPTAEYGMIVELEALWAAAEVSTGNSPSFSNGYNSVERNFYVGSAGLFTTTTPCTYSSFYPNGTTNGTTPATVAANGTVNNRLSKGSGTATADCKVEYIIWSNSTALNTGGFKVDIGRGMTASGNGPLLLPLSGTHNADKNARLRIETGTYNGGESSLYGTPSVGNYLVHLDLIFGSDYDRAKGDNTQLTFANGNTIVHGAHTATDARWLSFQHLDIVVKSGKMQPGYFTDGSATYNRTFYCRSTLDQTGRYPGITYLTIEGGEFASVNGGRGNYQDNVALDDDIVFSLRMKGGTIHGSIYGAASANPSHGGRRVVLTGGMVEGWIAGGCDGTSSGGGATIGDAYFYIGGNATVGSPTRDPMDGTEAGNIFGAGRGNSNHGTSAQPASMRNAFIAVADNGFVLRNVYGGGDYGYTGVTQSNGTISDQTAANFFILGGTVQGAVHGGGNNNNSACSNANITMTGGLVKGGIYGGSNNSGTMAYNVNIQVNGGQVGTDAAHPANIHGGGYGSATRVSGNVEITLGSTSQTTPGVTVYGDVYGGSALGYVNGTTAADTYHTYVTLNKGTINGSLYGGGLGAAGTAANVYGPVAVKVYGGSVNTTTANGSGAVYGCNNINGAPQRAVTVDIYATDPAPSADTYALDAVYGGGNQANYSYGTPVVKVHNCDNSIGYVYGGGNAAHITNGNTDVTIYGGNKIGNVFGGGNGTVTAANVSGNTNVKIYGGTIGRVFGGSNSQGTIGGTITVNVNKTAEGSSTACAMKIGEVYSGGNMANSNAGSLTIGCTGDLVTGDNGHAAHPENIGISLEGIGAVYGGANQADIGTSSNNSNITLNINSGMVANVFGGNNTSGTIYGTIQVNVNKTSDACGWYVGNVFGGGNLAQYSSPNDGNGNPTYPHVSILNGTVSGNVYGGGKGLASDHTKGQVTGNPIVTIGDDVTGHKAIVTGDVYGGGDAGNVVGTPKVNVVNKCDTEITNVYGGGNAADVNGTDVNIDGGIISGMVFGGGHGDKNATPQTEANVDGNVAVDVTGGTINKVFGGSNSKGAITGSVAVNIDKGANSCEMHITEVYGGGNEAAGNAGTITIKCTGDYEANGEGITTVYGGANAANVGNSINLTIKGGHIDNVYGGNNQSGSISGTTTVTVNWDDALTCGKYLGNVFGGGNLATLNGAATVNIQKGTVSHNVYGGGNQAGVGSATVSMTGGSVLEGLYGGCNTSGTVGGAISVSLTGGTIGTSSNRADVFGGGLGSATATAGNIGVTLNGTTIYGDLYGGSALGQVNGSTSHTTTIDLNSATLYGTIYGGGKGSNEGSGTTAISNGNVIINHNIANTNLTGFYGGANINGNVKGSITVNVLANVGASGNTLDIFGGGLGQNTCTEGNVTVTVGPATATSWTGLPVIYGDIYGGSALGNVNDAATDLTKIDFLNGTLHGTIFGGGLGDKASLNTGGETGHSDIAAKVNGRVEVNISSDSQADDKCYIDLRDADIYGCNNTNGSPQADVTVNIYKTAYNYGDYTTGNKYTSQYTGNDASYAIDEVFGGGKQADYLPENGNENSTKKATVYIHQCKNTVRRVFSGGDAAASTGVACTIEGGRFDYVFGGGNGEVTAANIGNGGTNLLVEAGIIGHLFGGSNTSGTISGPMRTTVNGDGITSGCAETITEFFGGGNLAPITTDLITTLDCGIGDIVNVYGGSNKADITGNVTLNIKGGTYTNVFGGSKGVAADPANSITGTAANITGAVTLNLYGGTLTNAFGGSDQNGNITGQITVNVLDFENATCPLDVTNIYGGGNVTPYSPTTATLASPAVNVMHIKQTEGVKGDVFGGGLGATAIATSRSVVTIGYDATTMSSLKPTGYIEPSGFPRAKVTGNVYGGGSLAAVRGNTNVLVQNATTNVGSNVFGGGSQAGVSGTTSVQIANGTVGAGVYGGCNVEGTVGSNVTVSVTGGTIGTAGTTNGAVYGGGLGADTKVKGNVAVTIGGGTINNDVYGGSAKGLVNCNDAGTAATSGSKTDVTLNAGTINGSLYGGGHGIDNANAHVWGPVQVTVNGGTVTGSIYGCNNANGAPQSTVKVDIYGTDTPASGYALANVFGGGNLAGYGGTPDVTIHNCDNSIGFVYGGGNAAPVAGTNVKVYGGNTIGNVFGGGNGTGVAANFVMVTGNVLANIYGGTIGKVFGGNNSSGTITGNVSLTVNKGTEPGDGHTACDMKIGEVYGGGNMAAGNAGTVTIGCTGDLVALGTGEHYGIDQEGIRYVYGGANQAGINNNIVLNINSGIVENVFGGNNTSGNISGTITVNIEKNNSATCATDWYIGNVYGGGNLASYSNSGNYPAVNIKNGTVSGDVFGGGLGASAKVRSNPVVTVGDLGTAAYVATVNGNVYGGGSAAMVGDDDTSNPSTNNTTVLIQKSNTTVSKVFGGGMAAGVTGTSGVTITDGTINTGVYGGCDSQGDVKGKVTVNVKGGTLGSAANLAFTTPVTVDVYGGGYGAATTTSGDVEVNIGECTSTNVHSDYPMIYGDVYGGSALGKVNGSNANTTTVNVLNGRLYTFAESATTANGQTYYKYHGGNVYGGGLGDRASLGTGHSNVLAEEKGKIIVNIGAPGNTKVLAPDTNIGEAIIDGNVYGCNNTNGSPQDDVTVNIYRTHREETDIITYTGPETPTFALNDVFGGGNQADYTPATTGKKSTVQIHGCHNTIHRVFGGSNAAASGSSLIPVEVNTNINGGRFYNVFGGGNGEVSAANIYGDVKLEIHGGIVNEFYIGSNQNGSISGSSKVTVDQSSGCDEITITEFYCGGKYADYIGNINAEISCSQGLNVNYLYGGCKEAHVRGNVHLVVKGGTYDYIFGGSRGTPTKGADIQGNVTLEVLGGTVRNAIFGGSNVKGAIGGNITVKVEQGTGNDCCPLDVSLADVYGGGNQADYPGTPSEGSPITVTPSHVSNYPAVNIKNATVKNVFGGGLEAEVDGDPQIQIKKGSKILGNVYGGGNMGEVEGNPRVIINGKQVN